jgi:aryl-alcohol dehydrogenase-like predicted oxidoreductase
LTDHPARDTVHPPDDDMAIATIHAALDSGVTLIDTARAYTSATHPGHSEAVIARALASHPAGANVVVATKGGHYRDGDEFPIDARPDTIRRHCETSRELLGVDTIELYQLHWPDPNVPMRKAMEAFARLQGEGAIRQVGLSNVSLTQLEEAMAVVPIASVENRFSALDQSDRAMVDYCAGHGVAYLAYSPLGGGGWPSGGGAARLTDAFPAAGASAERRGVSIQRLALAWLLSLSPTIIPICGASRPGSIRDSAPAAQITLTVDEAAGFQAPSIATPEET